jgi:hypothetical protein
VRFFRHRKIWIGWSALAFLLGGIFFLVPYLAEPRYQGRRLSYWLGEYLGGTARAQAQAEEAVLAIGSEGVPTLMRLLLPARESSLKRFLERKLGVEFIRDDASESARRQMGAIGFQLLGERAAPAIPLLVPILEDPDRSYVAWETLTSIGAPALPTAQRYLASTNSYAKERAVWAMVALAKTNEPAWHMLLTNSDPAIRATSYLVLGARAPLHSKIYDLILTALNDPNEQTASAAALAFRTMGDFGTNALPRLYEMQKTTNALLAAEISSSIKNLERRMRLQKNRQAKERTPE